nr:MAG TPA: hypothetical protein [Caudoviricetes sp.]
MKASSFASSAKTGCSCSPSPLGKGRRVVLTNSLY